MTQQIHHAQSTYELRNGHRPSYAQLDRTKPEFEIRRARRVAVPREARLIVVAPTKKATGDGHHGQDDTGAKR